MGRHVIEAMGMCRVVIEDGEIVEITPPIVDYCPLFKRHRDIDVITEDEVRSNIEFRIRDFGMCTPRRQLEMRDFLSFGISEMLAMAVRDGLLDCAVIVCDGAGTVVVDDPVLIQGIGGRVSGIIETCAYDEVVERIGRDRVLDPETGAIDQMRGVELALSLGYDRIGVTLATADDAVAMRESFPDVVIMAVHTTGATTEDAELFFDKADVITSCASLPIREVGRVRALLQVGSRIPIYAATESGKGLMLRRLEEIGKEATTAEDDPPRPLL